KGCPRDMLGNRFLSREFKACRAVKVFQIPVLVQMLDRAAHIVKLAHQVVMAGADEQLGPALELLLCLARGGQDQAIDATAILVNPVNNLRNRARLRVDVQGPEQAPVSAHDRRSGYSVKVLAEMGR